MTFPTEDSEILTTLSSNLESILEFGPGLSTEAFIRAGCKQIVTCEHHPKWYSVAVERFKLYPQVQVLSYFNTPSVYIPEIDGLRFDLAFVDNPVGAKNKNRVYHSGQEDCARWNTLEFALGCSDIVVLHDAKRKDEQNSLERAKVLGWNIQMYETRRGLAVLRKNKYDTL